MTDEERLASVVVVAIKTALVPVVARVADLEAREPEPGPEGPRGLRGEKGDPGAPVQDPYEGIDVDDLSRDLSLLLRREIEAPPRVFKRVVRDASDRVTGVVEETV